MAGLPGAESSQQAGNWGLLRGNMEKLLTVLTHVDDSVWIPLWNLSLSRCWPQLGSGDLLLCSHARPIFSAFAAAAAALQAGKRRGGGELRDGLVEGEAAERGESPRGRALWAWDSSGVSVGNKEKQRAQGQVVVFREKGRRDLNSIRLFPSSSGKQGSILVPTMVWVLPEDLLGFSPICLPGYSPIPSDCVPKLFSHKQFLFFRKRLGC